MDPYISYVHTSFQKSQQTIQYIFFSLLFTSETYLSPKNHCITVSDGKTGNINKQQLPI